MSDEGDAGPCALDKLGKQTDDDQIKEIGNCREKKVERSSWVNTPIWLPLLSLN